MCAMIVESLLRMMPNWDCTTMLCTVKKPFECTQCGEKGSGVQKFKNHMEIVENLVDLIKDVVGMSLPVPNMGIYHHKIQKTKCTECHISIAATSIPRHMKTVHGAQIGKQIKCGKCLQTKDRLLQHQKFIV